MNYRLPVSFVLLFLCVWLYHPATHAAEVEISLQKGVSIKSTSSSGETSTTNEASGGNTTNASSSSASTSESGLVQRTTASLTSTLSDTVKSVADTAQKATSDVVSQTTGTVDNTTKVVTEAVGNTAGIVSNVSDLTQNVTTEAEKVVSGKPADITGVVSSGVTNTVNDTVNTANSAVSGTVSTTTEAVAETVKTVDQTVKAVTETTSEAVTEVVDTTGTVVEAVPVIVKDTVNPLPVVSTPVTVPPVGTIPPIITVPPISTNPGTGGEAPVSGTTPGGGQHQAERDNDTGTAVKSPVAERPAGVEAASPIKHPIAKDVTAQSPIASTEQPQPQQPIQPEPFSDQADISVQAVSTIDQPATEVSDVDSATIDPSASTEPGTITNTNDSDESNLFLPASPAQQTLQSVSNGTSDRGAGDPVPFAPSGLPLAQGWNGDLIGVLNAGSSSAGGQLSSSGGNSGGTAPTAMVLEAMEASLFKQPVWIYSTKSQRGSSQWMNAPPAQPPQSAPYFNRHLSN